MKISTLLISVFLISLSAPAMAATTIVHVNGLVCDFCARAIEKVFGDKPEVQTVKVDLDAKIITIDFKDKQTMDDATITKLVTDAGYKVVSIDKGQAGK